MNILVTGASGLVGAALSADLTARGHRVAPLRRSKATENSAGDGATWCVERGEIELGRCGALDAVVHLAGETVAQRWTSGARRRIRESRVRGTALLVEGLARLSTRPKVLVSASAIGFYGASGETTVDESSAPGEGFLAEICREWEEAAAGARSLGIRVVHLRLGLVLSAQGGALARMLPVFRAGLGGPLADGAAWWSWVSLPDVLSAIRFAIECDALTGAANCVAPHPVRNAEFTRALGRALRRPAVLPVPGWVLKTVFGEMALGTMLASIRTRPARLEAAGFRFRDDQIEPTLRAMLERQTG